MLRELIDTTTLEEFVAGLALESGLSIRIYDDDGLHLFSTMPTSEFGRLTAGSRSHLSPQAIGDLTADLSNIDVRPARIDDLTPSGETFLVPLKQLNRSDDVSYLLLLKAER